MNSLRTGSTITISTNTKTITGIVKCITPDHVTITNCADHVTIIDDIKVITQKHGFLGNYKIKTSQIPIDKVLWINISWNRIGVEIKSISPATIQIEMKNILIKNP